MWPGCQRFAFRSFERPGWGYASSFLLGGTGGVSIHTHTHAHTQPCGSGDVSSCMLRAWPQEGSVFCSGWLAVGSAEILCLPRNGLKSLGLDAPWSGCKIQEKVSGGCSQPVPLGLKMTCPCPSLGPTGFQALCWDCPRSARCTSGSRQLETPSVLAGCCGGG